MTVSLFHPERPLGASKPIDITELHQDSCRWAVESSAPHASPWAFCGLKRVRGAYCATHAAMAYRD
jgi:hypothetical protein